METLSCLAQPLVQTATATWRELTRPRKARCSALSTFSTVSTSGLIVKTVGTVSRPSRHSRCSRSQCSTVRPAPPGLDGGSTEKLDCGCFHVAVACCCLLLLAGAALQAKIFAALVLATQAVHNLFSHGLWLLMVCIHMCTCILSIDLSIYLFICMYIYMCACVCVVSVCVSVCMYVRTYVRRYVCAVYMHQALPPPLPPPYGMGPIYWSHMRSSPSPPCGVVGVWHCPPPPLWCGGWVPYTGPI